MKILGRSRLTALLAAMALSACTYTRAVTQTNVPRERSHPVSVDVKRYIFFATFDTDEVQDLTHKLREKCPGGRVTGIMAKDTVTLYFLFIFYAREVEATGFCLKHATADEPDTSDPIAASEDVRAL